MSEHLLEITAAGEVFTPGEPRSSVGGSETHEAPEANLELAKVGPLTGTFQVTAAAWQSGTNDGQQANARLVWTAGNSDDEISVPTLSTPVPIPCYVVKLNNEVLSLRTIKAGGAASVYHGLLTASRIA